MSIRWLKVLFLNNAHDTGVKLHIQDWRTSQKMRTFKMLTMCVFLQFWRSIRLIFLAVVWLPLTLITSRQEWGSLVQWYN